MDDFISSSAGEPTRGRLVVNTEQQGAEWHCTRHFQAKNKVTRKLTLGCTQSDSGTKPRRVVLQLCSGGILTWYHSETHSVMLSCEVLVRSLEIVIDKKSWAGLNTLAQAAAAKSERPSLKMNRTACFSAAPRDWIWKNLYIKGCVSITEDCVVFIMVLFVSL